MAICVTDCNVCGHTAWNSFASFCVKCDSTNIDREYDPDLSRDEHFEDNVDNSDFDEDDL